MQELLRHAARRVVAVSPIIGGQALKGPAGKIMSELGLDVSAEGWTRWMNEQYPGLVDVWVWDEADQALAGDLRSDGHGYSHDPDRDVRPIACGGIWRLVIGGVRQ
jgi:LPPG:FO 2-phospho-L-lactate transferase